MKRQPRLEYPGALYHVTARGADKRPIFRDDADRRRYLDLLAAAPERFGTQLHAFCLMSNHLHLALQVGRIPLSRIIRSLHTGYAQYFNRKHGRTGPLFEGRYRAVVVDKESYLLSLVRYIHRNPVEAKLVDEAGAFPWSSHALYLKGAPPWLVTRDVLALLGDGGSARARFRKLVSGDGADAPDEMNPMADAAVGDEDFVRAALKGGREDLFVRTLTIETVAAELADRFGVDHDELSGPSRLRKLSRVRGICALVMREVAEVPVARVARYFRRDSSTLSRDVRRLEQVLAKDPAARAEIAEIETSLAKRVKK